MANMWIPIWAVFNAKLPLLIVSPAPTLNLYYARICTRYTMINANTALMFLAIAFLNSPINVLKFVEMGSL